MRIFTRIRNKRGASIIFAMLIMLVCTVIASVVLAAATSAAGRIVKTSASDRRYYAVNSAVNLLKDLLEDEGEFTFKWTYQETQDGTAVTKVDYLYNSTYTENLNSSSTRISELLMETILYGNQKGWTAARYGTRDMEDLTDIFMNATLDLLVGTNRTDDQDEQGVQTTDFLVDAWNSQSSLTFDRTKTASGYNIRMDGSGVNDVSEVSMTSILESDGRLIITITGGEDDSQGTGYSVRMIFRAQTNVNDIVSNDAIIKIGSATTTYDETGGATTTQKIRRAVEYERNIVYDWYLESVVTLG